MDELWVSFCDDYDVSSFGRVRRRDSGRAIKLQVNRRYFYATIRVSGSVKSFRVHCLVAASFIGARPPGAHVNHIDGDKLNNRASNLEYVTPRENCAHSWRMGLSEPCRNVGVRNGRARIGPSDARIIRARRHEGMTLSAIAKMHGISPSQVRRICTGENWASS